MRWHVVALCGLCGLLTPLAEALQIGEKIPKNLELGTFVKGSPLSLERERGKRHVLLLLWKLDCPPCKTILPRLDGIEKRHQARLAVAAVGSDHVRMIRASGFADKLSFPVAAGSAEFFKAMRREGEELPLALLFAPDGTLLWRGTPAAAEMVLTEVLAGKFNMARIARNDRLNYELQQAGRTADFAGMVRILDRELVKDPRQDDLLAARAQLMLERLKKPEEAMRSINSGIKLFPKKMPFYVLKLRAVEGNLEAERAVFGELIRNFSDDPGVLVNIARKLMRRNVNEMNLQALCDLAEAALRSGALRDNQRCAANEVMARICYFGGRPDLAVKHQETALRYAANAIERTTATRHLGFYRQAEALRKRFDGR